MTAQIAAWGRLAADPDLRTSRNGKPWCTARMAVDMPAPHGADEGTETPTLWLNVITFSKGTAETLARHRKGECISVSGSLEMRPYTSRSGEKRDGMTCVAKDVIGPRSPRPKGGGARISAAGAPAVNDRAHQGPLGDEPPPFNDDLPF